MNGLGSPQRYCSVNISHNCIGHSSIDLLFNTLEPSFIEELYARFLDASPHTSSAIIERLAEMPRLHTLALSGTPLSSLFFTKLRDASLMSLQQIDLFTCHIGPASDELLTVLASMPTLVIANLWGTQLQPVSALRHFLSPSAACAHSLIKVVLGNNMLGDRGLTYIAEGLRSHPTVQRVDLAHCGVTDASIDELCTVVEGAGRLTDLNLNGNCLTPAGVAELQAATPAKCRVNTVGNSVSRPPGPKGVDTAAATSPHNTHPNPRPDHAASPVNMDDDMDILDIARAPTPTVDCTPTPRSPRPTDWTVAHRVVNEEDEADHDCDVTTARMLSDTSLGSAASTSDISPLAVTPDGVGPPIWSEPIPRQESVLSALYWSDTDSDAGLTDGETERAVYCVDDAHDSECLIDGMGFTQPTHPTQPDDGPRLISTTRPSSLSLEGSRWTRVEFGDEADDVLMTRTASTGTEDGYVRECDTPLRTPVRPGTATGSSTTATVPPATPRTIVELTDDEIDDSIGSESPSDSSPPLQPHQPHPDPTPPPAVHDSAGAIDKPVPGVTAPLTAPMPRPPATHPTLPQPPPLTVYNVPAPTPTDDKVAAKAMLRGSAAFAVRLVEGAKTRVELEIGPASITLWRRKGLQGRRRAVLHKYLYKPGMVITGMDGKLLGIKVADRPQPMVISSSQKSAVAATLLAFTRAWADSASPTSAPLARDTPDEVTIRQDFVTADSRMLTVRRGDKVKVVGSTGQWVFGELGERRGYFPASYSGV